jgi:FAD/FMN-containing dehydrogenase
VNRTASDTTFEPLAQRLSGRLVLPSHADYDAVRRVFPGHIDRHPRAIAEVVDATDVAQVIAFARESGLELAVRCGGHSANGFGTTDRGIVLDVRQLRSIEIDDAQHTGWFGAGLSAADVTQAAWSAAPEGSAGGVIGFGDTGSVGISGITLGGGIGYLVRKHGLTVDNLLAAELVLADGRLITASDDENPDLFWAIRGGGGNFGVVTRFKYRIEPAEGFYGGMLVLPATAETVSGFMAAAAAAPDELSTIANVMTAPMPFLPPEAEGRPIILGFLAYLGDAAAGERAVGPFRALAEPWADMLAAQPYPAMYGPEDESYRPKAIDHTLFMDHVDAALAQNMLDAIDASDAPLRGFQLRQLGGALARVPADATAFAHRAAPIMAIAVSFYEGEDDFAAREKWVHDGAALLDQGVPGAYVNFVREPSRIREAYPSPHWEALRHLKSRYDPANLFRLNHNIPPAD